MKASQPRLVIDASITIDLHHGGIVELLFTLPYEFESPDVIIAEMIDPAGADLEILGLKSVEFSGEEVAQAMEVHEQQPQISIKDIFAFMHAQRTGLPLLTGDRNLRRLTEKHKMIVHGTLWVLDEMVAAGILTKGQAAHALRQIVSMKGRLPTEECKKRLRDWEGS